MFECTRTYSHTNFERLGNVSRNDFLFVFRALDQSLQAHDVEIMFVVGDRNPS